MLAIVAFLILVLFIIPLEHLALARHPYFAPRELLRRAVGIGTVMALALIPVVFGGIDLLAWLVVLAGFLLAGLVLTVMVWFDRRGEGAARVQAVRSAIHEQIERWTGVAD